MVGAVALGEQGEKGWRAHAWLLEKFFPEARPEQKIEHSGKIETPAVTVVELPNNGREIGGE